MKTPGNLHLIDLDQALPGQRRFISCWAQVDPWWGPTFLIDPGPPATADLLIAELEEFGLQQLDFILLTHIHLDHGGATAQVLSRWPRAKVICHPRGRRHLVNPSQLWAGSLQVLGPKAEVYGEPQPVPETALAKYCQAKAVGIEVTETPGHAPHHICFSTPDDLFLGEAAGTFSDLGGELDNTAYYLRPATPPRFDLTVAQRSLRVLQDLRPVPRTLRFAHHGAWSGNNTALLEQAHDQLALWVGVCRDVSAQYRGVAEGSVGPPILAAIVDELKHLDPLFQRGGQLPADIQKREADFTRQSLRGMLDYLRRQADSPQG